MRTLFLANTLPSRCVVCFWRRTASSDSRPFTKVTDVIGRRALSSFTVVLIVLLQGFVCQVGAQTLTVLHNFSGADGANPIGGLILAPDDYIYGTTVSGDQSGTTNYPCSPGLDVAWFSR